MNAFKWKHFEAHIILMAVRWYLRYSLRYRDIVELLKEKGAIFPTQYHLIFIVF